MAKKEIKTDLWVNELLKEAGIELTPQGCDIKEIGDAQKPHDLCQIVNYIA